MSRLQGGGGYGRQGNRGHGGFREQGGRSPAPPPSKPLFDPAEPLDKLLNDLAEEEAKRMPDAGGRDELKSSQLRRFFGDVKDLYRRWQRGQDYTTVIAPMFKMIRSKASYAWRNGRDPKIPRPFYQFLDEGVAKVKNESDFGAFVQHFEAVVGFLYGLGKVGK